MTTTNNIPTKEKLTPKDFVSDQEVRWCPGCGDYSILKQVQTVFPDLGVEKENFAFISGIGCSSRFPYYMDTFGMHSIHGRAAAIASGLKAARPELSVWMVTGDGDSLSIGGNHFIHLLRRNFDINMLLFNNQIYGLTKGQYSPTSETGKVTKTTPFGSIEEPFNPAELALGAKGTFIARSLDRDPKHMQAMIKRAFEHKGTSFLEIYQNCNVFNDTAFFTYSDKETKKTEALFVEHGKPLIFGENEEFGIVLEGLTPKIITIDKATPPQNIWIHDEQDKTKANILVRMFDDPNIENHFPRPFGVFYSESRTVYETMLNAQIETVKEKKGKINLNTILSGEKTWEIL